MVGDMFYIVTSPQSACPDNYTGDACLTLNEFATRQLTSLNVTLEMQPGNHSFDSGLRMGSINFFKMQSSSSAMTNIVCNTTDDGFTAWISVGVVSSVVVKGITFFQCGQIVFRRITNLDIYDVSFSNCLDSISIEDSQSVQMTTVSLGRCQYLIVSDTTVFTFQNSTVQDSGSRSGGANAVLDIIRGRSVTIAGSLFSSSIYSAPLEITSYDSVVVDDCTFNNNQDFFGAALTSFDSSVTIRRSVFSHNSAFCQGGAVYVHQGSLTVHNSIFRYNIAWDTLGHYCSGGAIFVENSSLAISDSTFEHNSARANDGGAVCNFNGDPLVITDCRFESNQAGDRGGALCSTNSTTIEKSFFSNNRANLKEGGAVYSSGTDTAFISESTFIDNTAPSAGGGAIYSTTDIEISDSTFTSNSAPYCGVLFVGHNNSISIDTSTFRSNRATSGIEGGGVACIVDSCISVFNSSFRQNSAGLNGGVFLIEGSTIDITSSDFVDNSASHSGGVMYTNAYPSNYTITNSNFSGNGAGINGGVMFIGGLQNVSGSDVSVNQSSFSCNHATERGGVFDISNNAVLEIHSAYIFNNTANQGGVISACDSEVTISGDYGLIRHDDGDKECILYDDKNVTTTSTESIQTTTSGQGTTTGETPTSQTTMSGATGQSTTTGETPTSRSRPNVIPYVLAGVGGAAIVISLVVVLVVILAVWLHKSKKVTITRKSETHSYIPLSKQEVSS